MDIPLSSSVGDAFAPKLATASVGNIRIKISNFISRLSFGFWVKFNWQPSRNLRQIPTSFYSISYSVSYVDMLGAFLDR